MNENRCKRVLCLWLPNWPIQRLVVAQPELKGQTIALYHHDPRRGHLVAACSSAARQQGIKTGMPLSEAKSLIEQANDQLKNKDQKPASFFLHHEPECDREVLEKLADDCEIFSPIVGLEQIEQPSCIFMDITGLDRLFMPNRTAHPASSASNSKEAHPHQEVGEAHLARQVSQHFEQIGYWPCLSVAPTVGLAWALRHRTIGHPKKQQKQPQQPHQEGLKRNRIVIFPAVSTHPGTQQHLQICKHPSFLSLPVHSLRLPTTTFNQLHQLGVYQMHQLLQLPRNGLATRLGAELLQRLDQATGRIDEVIVARHKPPEFELELFLEHPTDHQETLETILSRQLTKICHDLAARQQGALQVTCRFLCDSETPHRFASKKRQDRWHKVPSQQDQTDAPEIPPFHQRQFAAVRIGLFQPTASSEHLLELLRMQLEHLQLPGAVHEVRVTVPLSARLSEQQRHLFDENPRDNPIALAQLINRLSVRLGEENVLGFSLAAGAQPESAYQLHRLAGRTLWSRQSRNTGRTNKTNLLANDQQRSKTKRKNNNVAIENPFEQQREKGKLPTTSNHSFLPQPLDRPFKLLPTPILLETLSVTDGPPACFFLGKKQQQVVDCWGPERIQTGWWRGPMAQRDYWRVETQQGFRFWIFRELAANRWYLHGTF